jgi:para-aminobenzoate synthetase component 1
MQQIFTKKEAIQKFNQLGKQRTPFFFAIDYKMNKIIISRANATYPGLLYQINDQKNYINSPIVETTKLSFLAIQFEEYREAFDIAQKELNYGNSFLLNLTFPSEITSSNSLLEIFHKAQAKYKVHLPGICTVFSPETFVKIKNDKISSYPMKGTIDAAIPQAKEILLHDQKELAEHSTIVDLIRNDLSIISSNVKVTKFRYLDLIKSDNKDLYQMSSEIQGDLPDNFYNSLGELFFSLLPAGSISGAPKAKTLEIIDNIEQDDRSYYTGICGFFDGTNLDSGVMIRYIEQKNDTLYYRSGGGITAMSNATSEYQELLDKIYVPLTGNHKNSQRKSTEYTLSQPTM